MRTKIVAGNWKMNTELNSATLLSQELTDSISLDTTHQKIVLIPPFPFLGTVSNTISQNPAFYLGAQDVSVHEVGAYTGEVSALMLKSCQVSFCLVGHSERRMYHHEDDQTFLTKIEKCINNGITPIFCFGEPFDVREAQTQNLYVLNQFQNTIFKLSNNDFSKIILAYEPIWAIGTGKTATSYEAQEMHEYIRSVIRKRFNDKIADGLSILYGGSCNEKNAKELFNQKDIDGGLIGGASIQAASFIKIVHSLEN